MLPSNITAQYCGVLDHSNKDITIQKHHCLLFPTINENYGHVIAESLANNRPVILSKGTTPWDDLDGKAGFVIPLNNPLVFSEKIDYLAGLSPDEFDKLLKNTNSYFASKVEEHDSVSKHKEMLNKIIGEKV